MKDIKQIQGWQPIDNNTPRGMILACNSNTGEVFLVSSYIDGYRVFEEFSNNGCRRSEIEGLTHWQPLPTPPKEN